MISHFAGKPLEALVRLVDVAQGHSGQSHHVRRFLLGLYNAEEWPFELHRLRALDADLQRACLTVLELDICHPARELHQYLEDGDRIFGEFWAHESASDNQE